MPAQLWGLGLLVCKSQEAPSDDFAMLRRWTQVLVPAAPPPPSSPHLFPEKSRQSYFSTSPNEIPGREEREGNSLLCNDVQSQWASWLLGRTQGWGGDRKNFWKVQMCLGLGLRECFRSGFLLSHGYPDFHWMYKGTPIRRREMWEHMHRGRGVCSGGFIGWALLQRGVGTSFFLRAKDPRSQRAERRGTQRYVFLALQEGIWGVGWRADLLQATSTLLSSWMKKAVSFWQCGEKIIQKANNQQDWFFRRAPPLPLNKIWWHYPRTYSMVSFPPSARPACYVRYHSSERGCDVSFFFSTRCWLGDSHDGWNRYCSD